MRVLPILGLFAAFLLVKLAGNPELLAERQIVGNPLLGKDGATRFLDLTTFLGVIFVFLFYWFKFNEWAGAGDAPTGFRPRPARHFTTWLRYLGWNTLYGSMMVGGYAIIVFFPELVYRIVDSFVGAAGSFNAPVPGVTEIQKMLDPVLFLGESGLQNPIEPAKLAPYAVMLTTVVWAGMRPFSEFERRLRLRLQERAAIPTQARELVETFEKDENNFVPEKETVAEVVKHLEGNALDVEDFYDSGEQLWFLYARTEYLNHLLLKYNRSPVFSRLAERYVDEFKDLETSIFSLRDRVAQRISDIHDLIPEGMHQDIATKKVEVSSRDRKRTVRHTLKASELRLVDSLEGAGNSQKVYFRKQKKELKAELHAASRNVVQLIVCGVLAVGRSPTQRRDLLEAFGLRQQGRITIQLDPVTLTWVAGGALLTVFLCSTVYLFAQMQLGLADSGELPMGMIPEGMDDVLWWSVVACFMHLFATAGGYASQRSLETNRERLRIGKARPLMPRAQVAEALWSASFGLSLNIFLLGALAASAGNFGGLCKMWWWATVPGVTAFFAALYTQKVERSQIQLNRLLWLQAFITGLVATLVFMLLHGGFLWGPIAQEISGVAKLGVLVFGFYVAFTTTILGLALGMSLHMWVMAERYAGQPNRRSEKRQRFFLFKRAKWRTDSGELLVRALSISSSGAELKSTRPLEVESEGHIEIAGRKARRARVLRNNDQDPRRCYVQFLMDAAKI